MQWVSAIARMEDAGAATELVGEVESTLDSAPDLIIVFVTAHHTGQLAAIGDRIARRFSDATIIGCSAAGVIGDGEEIEDGAAVALVAASLPGVRLDAAHVPATRAGVERAGPVFSGADPEAILALVDPFSGPGEPFVRALDDAFPDAAVFGGLTSGGIHPGANALLVGDAVHRDGAVLVAMSGALAIDTIVAQGCRPIGEPLVVTRHSGNVILAFDRGNPAKVLGALVSNLGDADRSLVPQSLLVGIEMEESADGAYAHGDFLIRNLAHVDPNSGAIAVAAALDDHQVVQFHLRDAASSAADLAHRLEAWNRAERARPDGALLFSCVGRGRGMYGSPNHDSDMFADSIGDVPLGGFFCHGEIGAVGEPTFVHGYTSMFALFHEPAEHE